ncbi:MAG: 2-keto-4-methylthiobutyrate aminotransferase [Rhodospirillales bacterium]|nr:2-keto-4-methylthiobutyrate aminotransferase [Rhodospirillales bacterium]
MRGKVWLNGRFDERAQIRIEEADRGFTLGDGVFETLAVRGGKALRVAQHLARLNEGARTLRLPVPYDDVALARAISDTIRMNNIRDGVARLTVSRGPGERGLLPPEKPKPTVVIAAHPDLPPETSVRAVTARKARRDEGSVLARVKSLSYLEQVLARMEAKERGADEALLLNTHGRIADGTAANLFLFLGNWLVTPSLDEGALPGIVRAAAVRELGAVERPLAPEDVYQADEAMMVNSLGVRALVELDGRAIGDGQEGVWCAKLRELARADE